MIKCILIPKSERGQICLKRQSRMEIESCKKVQEINSFCLDLLNIYINMNKFIVQFSLSVVFDSLRPHGLQHPRPPLSITNSQSLFKLKSIESGMPTNHLIFCFPLPLCLQSIPASESFQMSQFFTSGGQRIGVQLQHQSFQRTDFL